MYVEKFVPDYQNLRDISNWDKLNSLTKYPSILTYHELGNKGRLNNKLTNDESFSAGNIEISEKIDGTNTRIIYLNGDYIIGSRDNLLYAKDDRVMSRELNESSLAAAVNISFLGPDNLTKDKMFVFYGETYGSKINGFKQYTNDNNCSAWRLFDIAVFDFNFIETMMDEDLSHIASWRDHGGQTFLSTQVRTMLATSLLLDTVPIINTIDSTRLPKNLGATYDWMQAFRKSNATLQKENSNENNKVFGKAEGVVIRTFDRSMIRKLRFEEYDKTFLNAVKK